jgi:hypothetical protein
MTTPVLTVWVIYRSPRDYPGKFVLRAQDVFRGNPEPVPRKECQVCDSLEEARRALPQMQMYEEDGRTYGAEPYRLDRHPEDDPTIVETWI